MTSLLLRNVTLNGSRTHVLIDKGVFADLKGSSCIVVGKKIKQLHWKAVV